MQKIKIIIGFSALLILFFPIFFVNAKSCSCNIEARGITKVRGNSKWTGCNISKTNIETTDSVNVRTLYRVLEGDKSLLMQELCYPFEKQMLENNGLDTDSDAKSVECSGDTITDVGKKSTAITGFTDPLNGGNYTGYYVLKATCSELQEKKMDKEKQTKATSNSNIMNQLTSLDKIKSSGSSASQGVSNIIGQAIVLILQFAGSAALLMFIYGGLLIMVSQGQSDKYQKGAKIMMWSAIGIIVMLSSYGILNFILAGLGA